MRKQNIESIKVSELQLWSENPRDPIDLESTDYQIISRALIDYKKKWNLQTFIKEMGAYYDLSELPTVVRINGQNVVYDGNRRIAILKYLQNQELYNQLGGGLFYKEEPTELKELTEIPCNVCDKQTALNNIERKHTNSGTWGPLERDYFLYLHRGKEKSLFISFDEQTGIISSNEKMNKRFVKDEMLTEQNLEKIGFKYNSNQGIVSNYSDEETEIILNNIVELVEKRIVYTRGKYRAKLKEPLQNEYPEIKIKKFDETKKKKKLKRIRENNKNSQNTKKRKTPVRKSNEILFGKTLQLKPGRVNEIYSAIDSIYKNEKNTEAILAILGMSLRFLLEVGARVYYKEKGSSNSEKDQLYKDFLRLAKQEMQSSKEIVNYLAFTTDWLNNKINLEGILGKYAHDNIIVTKSNIIENSIIVGEIIEHYFGRN